MFNGSENNSSMSLREAEIFFSTELHRNIGYKAINDLLHHLEKTVTGIFDFSTPRNNPYRDDNLFQCIAGPVSLTEPIARKLLTLMKYEVTTQNRMEDFLKWNLKSNKVLKFVNAYPCFNNKDDRILFLLKIYLDILKYNNADSRNIKIMHDVIIDKYNSIANNLEHRIISLRKTLKPKNLPTFVYCMIDSNSIPTLLDEHSSLIEETVTKFTDILNEMLKSNDSSKLISFQETLFLYGKTISNTIHIAENIDKTISSTEKIIEDFRQLEDASD